jgi:hypothetical protein
MRGLGSKILLLKTEKYSFSSNKTISKTLRTSKVLYFDSNYSVDGQGLYFHSATPLCSNQYFPMMPMTSLSVHFWIKLD